MSEKYIYLKLKYGYFISLAAILLFPGVVFAVDAGAIADVITGQGTQIANLILILSVLAGVALVAMGFITMFKASKGRGEATWGRGWAFILIGVGLTSLGAVVTSGSQSIWGSDQSAANLTTLGI